MTRDEITRMAREAGFVGMDGLHKGLCRFAALVAAAEREACANVCETLKGQHGDHDSYEYASGLETGFDNAKWRAAHAIRARGEKGQS